MSELRETPWTVAESSALPPETKDAMLRKAKPGTWYDGWQPYCGTCDSMGRMHQEAYGFRCGRCGNMIAWDMTRLVESPLNRRSEAVSGNYGHSPLVGALHAIQPLFKTPRNMPAGLGCMPGVGLLTEYLTDEIKSRHGDLIFQIPEWRESADLDASWHRSLDDKDPTCANYSRMETCPGPTGHPDHHRRQRKMKKASRQTNRRNRA
jgi:hypothetical protein